MAENDISETIIRLLEAGRVNWPKGLIERNKFISDNFGKVWDSLLDININANVEIFSHTDAGSSFCGACEAASGTAWNALCSVLLLILVLEDALGTTITFSPKYSKPDELSAEKDRVRSRIRP